MCVIAAVLQGASSMKHMQSEGVAMALARGALRITLAVGVLTRLW